MAIGIKNFAKPFLNFIDDTVVWCLDSGLDFGLSCTGDFPGLESVVAWCVD